MDKAIMILKLIPALIAAIKGVEEFIPISGAGKAKLDLIQTTMESSYADIASIWPVVAKVIDGLVNIANQFGVFKKPAPPTV